MTVDYKPFATGGSANVIDQATFAAASFLTNGFTSGVAQSAQLNKVWRQASMIAAAVANVISSELGIDVLDDGNLTTLQANLIKTIVRTLAKEDAPVTVAYSATPVFDASLGSKFEITLTGNVTSSTLTNVSPGQEITFLIKQDGTGGRTFAWPANVYEAASVNSLPNALTVQKFITKNDSTVHAANGALTQSLAASGYVTLPGGLIINWLTFPDDPAADQSAHTANWVKAFPNACLFAHVGTADPTAAGFGDFWYQLKSFTTTQVTVFRNLPNNPATSEAGHATVIGIGY